MRIRDVVMIGMMSAILVVVQVALGFLPNVELVSLLIILYSCYFGRKTLFIIYVFVLLEGIIYGFSLWWINYLYIWTILFIIATIFRKHRSPVFWAIVSGTYGLGFGALCAIPYFFIGGLPTAFAYWVSGIPYDIPHGAFNFIFALVFFYPLRLLFDQLIKQSAHNML